MPHLSTLFVKSALIYLALGFIIGGLILAAKATSVVSGLVWAWLPIHIVLLLNGWLIQLAIGVAYWILPRVSGSDRGRGRLAWGAFWSLQVGLALVVTSLLRLWWSDAVALFAPGVVLQALAVVLFLGHAWPRIKASSVPVEKTDAI